MAISTIKTNLCLWDKLFRNGVSRDHRSSPVKQNTSFTSSKPIKSAVLRRLKKTLLTYELAVSITRRNFGKFPLLEAWLGPPVVVPWEGVAVDGCTWWILDWAVKRQIPPFFNSLIKRENMIQTFKRRARLWGPTQISLILP